MPTIRHIAKIPVGSSKVRFYDDTLRKKQEAMMAKLRQEEQESIAEQTDVVINLTDARARVTDAGKDVDAFNADLIAGNIFAARKIGIKWSIPQSSVDEWITEH